MRQLARLLLLPALVAGVVAAPVASAPRAQPAERAEAPAPAPKKAGPRRKKAPATEPVDPYADPAPSANASPNPNTRGDPDGLADPYEEGAPRPARVAPRRTASPSTTPAPPVPAPPAPTGPAVPRLTTGSDSHPLDVGSVQSMLALQRLDGWLLVDRDGQNPLARAVVAPTGRPQRAWFYLIPARGEPALLVHVADAAAFAGVPGGKTTYAGYRDLDAGLATLLRGKKTLAMEYSAKGALPDVSRVDAGTIERLRARGVTIKSSDSLLQFTKALWGEAGRNAHYVAAHHLVELRKEALGFIATSLGKGALVTERDVQLRLQKGLAMRGLVGPAPVVAAGVNSADPQYVPTSKRSAAIKRGDVVQLVLAAKLDQPGAVFASTSWVAVIGGEVPERLRQVFEVTALARDQAVALVQDRAKRRRAVRGFEVDAAARTFVTQAGMAAMFLQRTGHSLDADLLGAGANLDDLEVKDTRTLVVGAGFTVGPALYEPGQFGVRVEVSAYYGPAGLEVTTPMQEQVEVVLVP